jgi:hypothetical protein
MSQKYLDAADSSGKVKIALFSDRTPDQAEHHNDIPCAVPNDMVVVGGGATGDADPGALLTASYPSADRSAWLASSASHRVSSPHRLEIYAIGMKIQGMSRADLLANLHYGQLESSTAAHPTVTLGAPPSGFTLISGGFRVNGPLNLATNSFPSLGVNWRVASQDHINPSPCTITAFAISIRTNLPGVGTVECFITHSTSPEEAHPGATVLASSSTALTGIGAQTFTGGPGQFLFHLRPHGIKNGGAQVTSKDHIKPSPGKIEATALGIRIA